MTPVRLAKQQHALSTLISLLSLPSLPPSHTPSSTSAMGSSSPPVDRLRLVTPYPDARATSTELRLSEVTAGKPAVLHLFTG